MKPNTLRVIVLLLYLMFLFVPFACTPRSNPFLVAIPSKPFASEPSIKVLFGEACTPLVPAGAILRFARPDSKIIFEQSISENMLVSSISGNVSVAGSRLASEGRLTMFSSKPVKIGEVEIPYPVEVTPVNNGVTAAALIPFEEYIAGVAQGEMYASWPIEALKAHAVAARSYAVANMLRKGMNATFHVKAGKESQRFLTPTHANYRKAAHETRGLVLFYKNRVLEAMYHSASGGRTADATSIYNAPSLAPLSSVVVANEASPFEQWSEQFNWPAFYKAVTLDPKSPPMLKEIKTETAPDGTVKAVKVFTTSGEHAVAGDLFRSRLGLKSNWFTITSSQGVITINGKGNGHRIGLSQYGAKALAEQGMDFSGILYHFYPGVAIVRIY